MIITLKRNLGTEDDLQPGEYVSIPGEHISGMMITVALCCPLCGHKHRLNEAHVIRARDGNVTPAFACPKCPLIEWLRLDGWAEVPR